VKSKNNFPLKKALATLLVGAFFLFFWINGPLQFTEALAHLDIEETPYSTPKLVGELQETKTHGEIGDVETHGEGWQLLHKNHKQDSSTSQLINLGEETQIFSEEHAEHLKNHVYKILEGQLDITPQTNENLLYLQIKQGSDIYYYLESAPIINFIKG
jgi:hypothetical protein